MNFNSRFHSLFLFLSRKRQFPPFPAEDEKRWESLVSSSEKLSTFSELLIDSAESGITISEIGFLKFCQNFPIFEFRLPISELNFSLSIYSIYLSSSCFRLSIPFLDLFVLIYSLVSDFGIPQFWHMFIETFQCLRFATFGLFWLRFSPSCSELWFSNFFNF